MGIKNISTLAEVDSFCRKNIYYILQRQYRWVFPDSKAHVATELFRSYIKYAGFGTKASYYKRTSKATRLVLIRNFNNAIQVWLQKFGLVRRNFVDPEEITYKYSPLASNHGGVEFRHGTEPFDQC